MTGTTTATTPAKNIGAPELEPAKCSMPTPRGIPAINVSEVFIWCYLSVRYEGTFGEPSCPLCSARGPTSSLFGDGRFRPAEPLNLDCFNVNAVVIGRFRACLDSMDRSKLAGIASQISLRSTGVYEVPKSEYEPKWRLRSRGDNTTETLLPRRFRRESPVIYCVHARMPCMQWLYSLLRARAAGQGTDPRRRAVVFRRSPSGGPRWHGTGGESREASS
jgi:hypothetical protein